MKNRFKEIFSIENEEVNMTKKPMLLGIVLIYVATIFVQKVYGLGVHSYILFTIFMLLHTLLYIFSNRWFKNKYWLYFTLQGIIIFDCAVIMPKGYEAIFIGLIPLMVFQSMIVYYDAMKVIITSVSFYIIFCGTIIWFDGTRELIAKLPILVIITIAVRAYAGFFIKQVKLHLQSKKLLKELELAYEKVEELTLINERQRVARDLHDTLSQGIAGIIMQLDAINANLNNNNVKRAQEIAKKSMEHARKTLADSRLVIEDLRFKASSEINFQRAVEKEVMQFKALSDISLDSSINIQAKLSLNTGKHMLYIIREGLTNIAKHSKATHAKLKISEENNQININIVDDGIGFDVKLLDKLLGHYGIVGITERVKAIHGKINISSIKKAGTNINISIPIEKGIYDKDE
ncbi:sensor histidine kinase [Clostridium sp. 19966]|nr:sensor histidine kinase [Clostridium sp. 19966]